ncbi:MAG: dihydrofolate reductase family protein [Planctomycetes bacterium]|nr:dihydrofolate reductase family protein [Planctomycetota bacterium]
MKITVYCGTSLDGFIARENGGIDWLSCVPDPPGEDYGFKEFFATVDALVLGRKTFEFAAQPGHWLYGDTQVFVLGSREVRIPEMCAKTTTWLSGAPEEIAKELGSRGYEHIYVDGGKTIHGFLQAGLVTNIVVTVLPILIGSGIPLFGPLEEDVLLELVGTKSFENGLVQLRYEVRTRVLKE